MIEATDLTMRYGSTLALDHASFKVEKGEIMGLLGPNGAGKTTAMKILTTQLVPTFGSAVIGGHDIHEEPNDVRRLIGYLPEEPPLYREMEVAEYLDFVGRARSLSAESLKGRMEWVVEKCGIESVYRKLIRTLSRGYKQRVGLAQALMHDPEVLILDEPTTGLDPLQIIGIRDLVKELAEDKVVIFSTHLMQEASAITSRIVIINHGRIIADSRLDELVKSGSGAARTVLTVRAPAPDVKILLESTEGVRKIKEVGEKEGFSTFEFETSSDPGSRANVSKAVSGKGWAISEFSEKLPSLEDAFIEKIRKSQAAQSAGKEVS